MKILIIATSVGDNAPGKVYEKFIKKLEEHHEISTICTKRNTNSINSAKLMIYSRRNIHHKIRKLSISLLSSDIFDQFLSSKISKDLINPDFDLIISMISLHNFFPLYLGKKLKAKWNIKLLVYSVDAIPPPNGWGTGYFYKNGLIRMWNNYSKKIDTLCFSNQEMLKYQLSLIKDQFEGETGVLYTPTNNKFTYYQRKDTDYFNLVYTGGLYQARKPEKLVEAFYNFQKYVKESRLYFIGTNRSSINLEKYKKDFTNKIQFVNYLDDLTNYYEISDVLIDIDADIYNDVFISSKFLNYLSVNRHILCITRNNSPSSKLIKNDKITGVLTSSHDQDEIEKCLVNLHENLSKLPERFEQVKKYSSSQILKFCK